jgi:divalent metal cation (Fe/Co/Zn/Cd) transporter
MDAALPEEQSAEIARVIGTFSSPEVSFHGLRTRLSGHRGFAEVHILVPGAWSVTEGHNLAERVETAVQAAVPDVALLTHLEPREDPRSYDDYPTEVPVTGV